MTATFIALTLLLAYVLHEDASPMRYSMLRRWRLWAASMLAAPWVACVLLLTPRSATSVGFFWVSWTALSVLSLFASVAVLRTYLDLRRVEAVGRGSITGMVPDAHVTGARATTWPVTLRLLPVQD